MKINLPHVVKLANLQAETDKKETLEKQLSEILGYIESLKEADTEGLEETSQVTGLENITREDNQQESLTQEEALSNSKKQEKGFFEVDAIFEE